MKLMLLAEKASAVRQSWSKFVDEVIHKEPKFVQRNERDVFISMNLEFLSAILESVRYTVRIEHDEEAGEYIATMDGFWFVVSEETEEKALRKIAEDLLDHAVDFYKDFKKYSAAPDFKEKFPKLIKALITDDAERIQQFFDVEHVRP